MTTAGTTRAGIESIVWKELRENARWALLGLLGMTAAMAAALEIDAYGYRLAAWQPRSLVSEEFQVVTAIGAAVCGFALGVLQTAFEARGERFSLLVHRPLGRSGIFGAKVAAGAVLYLFATALPFTLLSIWVATPGRVPEPFAASMMLPGAVDIGLGFAYYFAGMLTALREARWYASRGLGLAAAALCSAITIYSSLATALVVAVAGVSALGVAAWGSFVSGGTAKAQPRIARPALLAVVAAGVGFAGFLACVGSHEAAREWGMSFRRVEEVPIPGRNEWLPEESVRPTGEWTQFIPLAPPRSWTEGRYRWEPRSTTLVRGRYHDGRRWTFDTSEGVIHEYRWWWPLGRIEFTGYVDPASLTPRPEKPVRRLELLKTAWYYRPHDLGVGLLVFSDVVYENGDHTVRTLFASPAGTRIVGACLLIERGDRRSPAHAAVVSEEAVIVLDEDAQEIFRTPLIAGWRRYESVGVAALADGRYALYFTAAGDGKDPSRAPEEVIRIVASSGDVLEERRLPPRRGTLPSFLLPSDFAGPIVPLPAMLHAATELESLVYNLRRSTLHSVVLERWYLFVALAVASALGAFAVARRLALSREASWSWTAFALAFGPAGLLSLLCLEDWPARETCHACGRRRLVTREDCEHCNASWPSPQRDGTEIFEAV